MSARMKNKEARIAPTIIEPSAKHTHTFVLLHGLGSNGSKFSSELLDSAISSLGQKLTDVFPFAKFIFPNALWRRSSAFNRVKITQWFDIYSVPEPSRRKEVQLEGLAESFVYIRSIILEEMRLVPQHKIILGGLSQGCAMGLFTLLGLEMRLAAYFGMSGWLPFAQDIREVAEADDTFNAKEFEQITGDMSPALKAKEFVRELLSSEGVELHEDDERGSLTTPVFIGHGVKDEKVRIYLGEEAAEVLRSLEMDVSWKCYPDLGHWFQIPEEIDDIVNFLREKIGFPQNLKTAQLYSCQ